MALPTSITEAKAKKKPAAKKGAKKAPAKGKGKEATLRKKLVKLAGDHEDFDEFVEAALDEFPEVEDFDDLYADLMDEDGIFAEG